jgi:hypothetical protein
VTATPPTVHTAADAPVDSDQTRGGDFFMATGGDFFMATGTEAESYPIIVRPFEPAADLDDRLRRIFTVLRLPPLEELSAQGPCITRSATRVTSDVAEPPSGMGSLFPSSLELIEIRRGGHAAGLTVTTRRGSDR